MAALNYHKMNNLFRHLFVLSAVVFFWAGCSNGQSEKSKEAEAGEKKVYDRWLIDLESVESGCDRPDCIRSIDHPKFISVQQVDFLSDDDLVIGLRMEEVVRCYPHAILNWHEIVNDQISENYVAINYCPLTGSGMAWNRKINGKISDFGVSGMLYNSNIMPYDRVTRSAWSQMKQLCVNGELADSTADDYQVIETTWGTWKKLYPGSEVLSTETGMNRDYLNYPYHEYRTNNEIYFDVEYESDTLPQKERLFGVVLGNKAQCYRFNNFKGGVRILNDTAFEKNIIVVGSERDEFITAFENPQHKKYMPSVNKLPGLFKDEAGNLYDIFGYCIDGPLKGSRLQPMDGFMAYWFGWYAFYPTLTFE